MNFLFPAFLWGMLAVLIPLAIHLFNFRRTKRVLFTNVSFLKEIETDKSSFRKLKHLLILLARMLALACLAIAFAQPYLKEEGEAVGYRGVMGFYLDNSLSMQNEVNSKRFIDLATGTLDEMMSLYSHLTSLQLVTNDFSAGERDLMTASQFQDKLTSTELSPTSRTLEEVFRRQKRLLENVTSGQADELFWISDFQKSTSGNISGIEIDSTIRLNLIPIQAESIRNVFIDSVWLQTPFLREQQKNVLNVKISNSGNETVENLPVRLILNDTQVSATSVDIPPGRSENAAFDFNLNEKGFVRGMINFDDFPVTFDNQFFFVLNASPLLRILHLHEGSHSRSDPVTRVYRNDSLFQVMNAGVENLDIGQIAGADLVVLNEIQRLSPTLIASIVDFVRNGGSVLVIPPVKPEGAIYRPFLEQMGVSGLSEVSGGLVPLNTPDAGIPFFRDVFEASLHSDGQINMPSAANVWQWSNAGSTLLSLRNGLKFLSQIAVSKGTLYLLGAPLDATRGSFTQHALFVPVMYKIAAMSVKPPRTSYSFEEKLIELNIPDARPNSVFKLKNGETEFIPVQHLTGNQLVLELAHSHEMAGDGIEPGYFELLDNDKSIDLLAFNPGRKESELDFYSSSDLRGIFAGKENVTVYDEIEDGEFRGKLDKQALGTRLWKYFLYGVLFFLLAETLLVRLMRE